MGWTCVEELKWGDKAHPWVKPGKLMTNGPGARCFLFRCSHRAVSSCIRVISDLQARGSVLAGAYKIPTVNDVPVDFRVTLLRNAPNARAVHSSKAVGEPPFHLGASVMFAIKDAVYACRAQSGVCDSCFVL